MLTKLKNLIKKINDKLWAWCKNTGTILWARILSIGGVVLAALASMDWTPLVSLGSSLTGFDYRQLASVFIILAINGVITEIVRRRNADL